MFGLTAICHACLNFDVNSSVCERFLTGYANSKSLVNYKLFMYPQKVTKIQSLCAEYQGDHKSSDPRTSFFVVV